MSVSLCIEDGLDINDPYFWLPSRYNHHIFWLRDSEERWQCGSFLRESVRHTRVDSGEVSEVCGTCIATLLDGAQAGLQAMLKVHVQIPDRHDSPDELYPTFNYSKYKSEELSWEVETELETLQNLTRNGCKSVPRLIGYSIEEQPKDGYVPGGYIVYIVMEKVPGRNLFDFGEHPLEKRDKIRIAFGKAIRSEFYSHGYIHMNPGRSNVIWDEATNRCWIVDMEQADFVDPPMKLKPLCDWILWSLDGPNVMDGPLDETVRGSYDECSSDEALESFLIKHI
ncbi:hypothetical protein Plec18167_003720 [Paecilomyces lecythidis]|uniref:Aminoglycoside phosphotransferase domain-containing protein n=1 Tax=Paecilomyces lecythidis TaxID=3004212 RepID=A0ABR3XXN2_9EURO